MRHGSLFNGIGGFQLAAQWMDWENVFSCEIDDFCNRVTKHHFPDCIQHGDIKTTDFTIYRGAIDILTGGFPCQPYSQAGKRLGKEDDRHLWPEMLRAIQQVQPRYVVGENVRGITNWNGGLVFDEVQADLEAEGYEVLPFLLPACAVNAPHRRDRIWFIAHSKGDTCINVLADERHISQAVQSKRFDEPITTANPNSEAKPTANNGREKHIVDNGETLRPESDSSREVVTNTYEVRCKRRIEGKPKASKAGHDTQGGNERELWTDWRRDDLPSPTILRVDDGIPNGLDRIAALGNAIVPQVAYEIFKAIQMMKP